MAKTCEHFTVGLIAGQATICRLPILLKLCKSLAFTHWVGLGEPPAEEVKKILKQFKQFKYCPKCGQKLEFPTI